MIPNLVQYIFVPKKPKMSPGKIASQVSKVAILSMFDKESKVSQAIKSVILKEWIEKHGMMTVVLQVKNQTELHNVKHYLEQEKFACFSYNDEGYTEVPAGTMTAIATGIMDKEKEGWRFERFKLF